MIFIILEILAWELINGARVVISILDINDSIINIRILNQEDINGYRKSMVNIHLNDGINRLICSSLFMLIGIISFMINLFFTKLDPQIFGIIFSIVLFIVVGSDFIVDLLNRRSRKNILSEIKKEYTAK